MVDPNNSRLSTKVLLVSIDDSIRLRKTCNFPRQRNIRDLNVVRLGVEMEKGRFIQGTPIFMVVMPDGQQYIVNGNHTLEAIAYSGKPQWLTFIFLQVDTFEEAAAIYISFDLHKGRTWEDALKASGRDLTQPMAKQSAAAVKLIMSGFKYAPENVEANSSRLSRFDVMDAYNGPAGLLQEAMKSAPPLNQRIVMRAAVLAVALETALYDAETAVRFWGGLAQDNGLTKGDARKTLLQWLLSHKAAKGIDAYLQTRACAIAWNKFTEGKSALDLRPNVIGKITINRTPWDGNKGPDGDVRETKRKAKGKATTTRKVTGDEPTQLSDNFKTGTRVTEHGEELVVQFREDEEVE